ncbi:glycoside hydrolase family 9 protein [Vibrio sp. qd031]|uniref:glycoside hydrolase family 9 protein n=1 Tax=Vibrio sp. qd031 TaxID=1603038 RepID=UPI0018D4D8B1|nr:glycoside hydrolase family 9 protein [Vibrio sp. qd031]
MLFFTHFVSADEMVRNGNFDQQLDGWWSAGGTVTVADQWACMEILNPGPNPWSVILGHGGIGLEQGQSYVVSFDAYADVETQVKTLIQHEGPPYTHYLIEDTPIGAQKQSYQYTFTHQLDSDAGGEFQFQMGAQQSGNICFTNVSIDGKPYFEVSKTSSIRTNQLGFLPKADKYVFVQSESTEPLRWTLENAQGINIDMGRTLPTGLNKSSGENLHRIDLTRYQAELDKLVIKVNDETSFPFSISSNLYASLKKDALSYFYQNRSGIAIEAPFVQRSDLARPAGHPQDTATCFDKIDTWGTKWPGCDYTVDATGGWYDAGDHGKYTVNSGISTWTLLNLYERGLYIEGAQSHFDTAKDLNPEAQQGGNALLAEAKWNIEFMLAMQIPEGVKVSVPLGIQQEGEPLQLTQIDASYLAFHKIADETWTGMPLPPHLDTEKRYVGQPSTAATLNLSAVAAQCARIWRNIDPEFSSRCLNAAQSAWEAANRHSNIFAYDNFTGSGPYNDSALEDEFYWAAAELYLTTADDGYLAFITQSPEYLASPIGNEEADGDIFWQYTAPLGTISLAVVDSNFSAKQQAREAIVKTSSQYLAQQMNEGYNIPYSVAEYPWGSNSNLANRGIFLVYAHDFTNNIEFLKTAANAMDYLLGSNPMNISYVTGYGTRAASEPHHRFWANAVDENSPAPAPGALIGGPNSVSFSDPVAAPMKGHCIGQTCYKDKINAWTLNEITINWNAPLVWLSAALDEGKLN